MCDNLLGGNAWVVEIGRYFGEISKSSGLFIDGGSYFSRPRSFLPAGSNQAAETTKIMEATGWIPDNQSPAAVSRTTMLSRKNRSALEWLCAPTRNWINRISGGIG